LLASYKQTASKELLVPIEFGAGGGRRKGSIPKNERQTCCGSGFSAKTGTKR
jgi:hypothetical protein